MPFIAYVHEQSAGPEERPAWTPNWRVALPAGGALVAAVAPAEVHRAAAVVLAFASFALGCRALAAALPYREGLREHRQ